MATFTTRAPDSRVKMLWSDVACDDRITDPSSRVGIIGPDCLDRQGDGLAAADAEAGDSEASSGPLEGREQGHENAGSASTDRVSQGDGASPWTFTRSAGSDSSRSAAIATAANASLIS